MLKSSEGGKSLKIEENKYEKDIKVCIIGAGYGGTRAAPRTRRLDKREKIVCPPCEIPLVLGEAIRSLEELSR